MAARRVILPSADDLFRPTSQDASTPAGQRPAGGRPPGGKAPDGRPPGSQVGRADRTDKVEKVEKVDRADKPVNGRRQARPSGRVRHDEKMTVYITSEELLEIEHARLALRRTHGLAVDRGRLVREAVAIVLADLEANAGECALIRRLTEE